MAGTFDPNALIAAGPIDPAKVSATDIQSPSSPVADGDKVIDLSEFDTAKNKSQSLPGTIDDKNRLEYEEKLATDQLAKDKVATEAKEKEAEAKVSQQQPAAKSQDTQQLPPTAKVDQSSKPTGVVSDDDLKALGIADGALPLYRKMAKETQEHVVAELRRNRKELETVRAELDNTKKSVQAGLPNSWYEHENAYTLLPDYQKAAGEIDTLQNYSNYYRQQLIAIKAGDKWTDLVMGNDGKITSVERDPGPEADVNVSDKIRMLQNAIGQKEAGLNQLAGTFKAQARGLQSKMTEIEDHFFPQFKDREAFKTSESSKFVDAHFAAIGQGNNPVLGFVKRLYATFIELYNDHESLKKETEKGKIKPTGNGPTGEEIDSGQLSSDKTKPKKPEDEAFDENEWEAAKNRVRV